jgi:hypothetical protein
MPVQTDIRLLVPALENRAYEIIEELKVNKELKALGASGVIVTETLRELSVQMAYYSRGRMPNATDVQAMYKAAGLWSIPTSQCGSMITWTLDSMHLQGRAIDIAPSKNGSPWWPPADWPGWEVIGKAGENRGLRWGGRWKQKDCPHFEL